MFVYGPGIAHLSVNGCTDEYSDRVWPGNVLVLIPPTGHYDGYIEAEHERQRDKFAVGFAIMHQALERPAENKSGLN